MFQNFRPEDYRKGNSMRAKLLVLMFAVTVLALSSQPAAKASVFCPAYYCFDVSQACVNGGGAPIPEGGTESCYTLPSHDTYTIQMVYCYHPSTNTTTAQECYG
jgi:hypothetical protein